MNKILFLIPFFLLYSLVWAQLKCADVMSEISKTKARIKSDDFTTGRIFNHYLEN